MSNPEWADRINDNFVAVHRHMDRLLTIVEALTKRVEQLEKTDELIAAARDVIVGEPDDDDPDIDAAKEVIAAAKSLIENIDALAVGAMTIRADRVDRLRKALDRVDRLRKALEGTDATN